MQLTEVHFPFLSIVWGFAFDDQVLEKLDFEGITKIIEPFMAAFEGGLETAKKHGVFCYAIRQAFERLESSMSDSQKLRFVDILRGFLQGIASEVEVLDPQWNGERKERFQIFLAARLKSGLFELFQLFSEIAFQIGDLSQEPLIQ